jgi:hypothetical protein
MNIKFIKYPFNIGLEKVQTILKMDICDNIFLFILVCFHFKFQIIYFILGIEATFNMNCIYVCIFNALLHGNYSSNFRFTFLIMRLINKLK